MIALPRIIAHRGESALAPENTLAAIRLAASGGATWIEVDVNTSSDDVPFLHHDDGLERCTNGSGYLIAHPAKDLNTLDAGRWKDPSFEGEPLPTLTDTIDCLQSNQLGLNLEIKPTAGWEVPTTQAICAVIKDHWPADLPLLLSSFSPEALATAKALLPDVPRGYLACAVPPDWQSKTEALECVSFHCSQELLTERLAADIKAAGLSLLCFTVNSAERADTLFSWGVDSVFTDIPTQLNAAFKDR